VSTHSILHAQRMAQHREVIGPVEGNPSHFAEGGGVMQYEQPPAIIQPQPRATVDHDSPLPAQNPKYDGLMPDFSKPGIVKTPPANKMRVLPNGTIQLYQEKP